MKGTRTELQPLKLTMGFPHCPICVALAALSFLLVSTRGALGLMFIKEPLKSNFFQEDRSLNRI